MAVLLLWVLVTAFIGGSDATWCVCRSDVSTTALQKTLDYACGAGADCTPVVQNGACYLPNTVLAHCSYAANSFFQRRGQAAGTCDFAGTATIATTDPSYTGCSFPSTASAAGTGTGTATGTPTTTTPGTATGTPTTTPGTATGTPTTTTPGTTTGTPTTFNPGSSTNGVLGGLGPTGSGSTISADGSGAGRHPGAGWFGPACMALVLSCVVLLCGHGSPFLSVSTF